MTTTQSPPTAAGTPRTSPEELQAAVRAHRPNALADAEAAEAAGGAKALKSLAGPLPQVSFCPTGGVTPANAPDYLGLPNVVCVGGSWIAPDAEVAAGDWAAIEARAREASGLR